MSQTANSIFREITAIEQQLQRLKVRAYFDLPKRDQGDAVYPESTLIQTLKKTRQDIWQSRYAKKVKNLS